MTNSWEKDNCEAVKAHYAVYSVQEAAARWCGVTDDSIEQVLKEVKPLSDSGIGRGIWTHPTSTCVEPRSRAIAEAMESRLLPFGREDAKPVAESDHVAYERRHFFGRDLKAWIEKEFPNDKPAFLFDDIERNSHTSISVDSYRVLKAERDALKVRVDKAVNVYSELRDAKNAIELERDVLHAMVDKLTPQKNNSDKSLLEGSEYWERMSSLVCLAISGFPAWSDSQRKVQKTGNLQDWLVNEIRADNREAEFIKKVLTDIYKELR